MHASFVIPAKDEEAYLPETLESIRRLEIDVPREVVIVDGECVDATADW